MSVRFSIIVATYNRAEFLLKAIESVKAQVYDDFELIVVDDGSTDDTEVILKNESFKKLKYFKITNSERGFARNYGISKSKGEFVTFFDSDDLILPSYLLMANEFLTKNKLCKFLHCGYQIKNELNEILVKIDKKYDDPNLELIHGNFMSCIGVFVQRELFEDVRFEPKREVAGSEDWLLWLQLSARYKLWQETVITSEMINHDSRSVLSFNEGAIIGQMKGVIDVLKSDEKFLSFYGVEKLKLIKARYLSYISLHAIMAGFKTTSVKYLIQSIKVNPMELFTRRFLAIVKKLILGEKR